MSNVYFKASLQNTLNPEVGTFDNVGNKEGTFTLEDGEYYLTNTTSSSYRVYYPTENINSVGFTIEFDVNYDGVSGFGWCLLFSNDNYWHGFGSDNVYLQYRGQTLPNYNLITSPNTWLHVKCIFDYDNNPNNVHIYVNNSEVTTFTISNNYGIKYIDILGNGIGFVPTAKIKNIIIYKNKEHYLDTNGLTSVWSKIKSLFATKSELSSKANDSDVMHRSGDETIAGTKTFVGGSDSGLTTLSPSTQHSLLFGIGATGVNRGIYDNKNSRWSIFLNDTDYIMTQCPTPPAGDSSNKLATTGWVQTELDSTCVQTTAVDQTIAGTKTFSKPIVGSVTGSSGSCTGNAATATKLQTARTINGTSFNGTANITTANWGTARNISITDGTNTSTAVSVNGSAAVTLKLPAAIKANITGSLTGNAATATKATQDAAGNTITTTYATKAENNTKANNSEVVHKSGDETIAGTKTFNDNVHASGFHATATNAFMAQRGGYTLLLRNDGHDTYFLMSDKDGVPGTFSSARPLRINNPTGVCDINGNAATATKATQDSDGNKITTTYSKNGHTHDDRYYTETEVNNLLKGKANTSGTYSNLTVGNAGSATNATYANWLRTSSHSDHLFHTEWDKAGYFWTYVTTGNGDYRAVRVARSDSAATAQACTGNAATATKLAAARTIALSGAVTGTATAFDGSGNITIPVTALAASAIRAQWYAAYPDGAEAHNAMWGGRDITAAFNNGTVSANIANGTFRDIFPGDYITKQVTISGTAYTVNWVVADCDYWINKGDQGNGMETHHVVIVPQTPIFSANMNATNTTEGGYMGSRMFKETIPACATGIVNAFGASHILTFRDWLISGMTTNQISSGLPNFTGGAQWGASPWASVQCDLMTEKMVLGAPVNSASALDEWCATRQMSAFRLSEKLINYNRQWYWLRNIVSSAYFALVHGGGIADPSGASGVRGVRPFALLI